MRVAKMPYLQVVKGKYRVRMVVPPELRPIIGQANLTKWLGTGNEPGEDRQSRGAYHRIRRTAPPRYAGRCRNHRASPGILPKLDKPLNGWFYDIAGKPGWIAKTEPVPRQLANVDRGFEYGTPAA